MSTIPSESRSLITSAHRSLLIAAAVFTVMLIGIGGVLCVTQSIRNCPDWPGCFGSFFPPTEAGPILEYTHRLLAGISSLLILSSAVVGMVRVPRLRWISIPPVVAILLLVEVSFFGAQVVLKGLSPGWAAVDVGSALLVVALMVTAAVKATTRKDAATIEVRPGFLSSYSKLVLATTAVVYIIFVSGILVAGKGSFTACLGWPLYNLSQFRLDGHLVANILRLILSLAGLGMLVAVFVLTWQKRNRRRGLYRAARWVSLAVLVEVLGQVALQVFGPLVPILVVYTLAAAALWGLLVMLAVRSAITVPRT